MFRSGGLAQPPAGNWVADVKDATHWHVRFNHVTLGRVDWSAYVAYSEEWDIGSKPLNGWTYAGGGPAPFPALDSINFCPELVRH